MHNQLILPTLPKTLIVFLQIRPSALRPRPDRRPVTLIHISRRTRLIDMRSVLIERRHQQPHSIRPPDIRLRRPLMPIRQIRHQPPGGQGRPVHVLVIQTLVPHPLGQSPRIGRETGDADADVVVDVEDLLLVGGEFGDGAFEGADDGVGGGAEGDAGGALFDGFHGVFDLEEAAFGGPDGDVGVVLVAEHGWAAELDLNKI
mmetsp:Transcript_9986/g.18569  ORF Transcript_9986/g.18569 Transcript_9986/m.18569 type:complete len:202 (+) Transcript_9986:471-1076(+)